MVKTAVIRNIIRFGTLLVSGLTIAWLLLTLKGFYDRDECFDKGGGWNEATDQCDMRPLPFEGEETH